MAETKHVHQTQFHTTPVWRLIGTAAAIAGVTAIGYSLALTDLLDEFSVAVSSAAAFIVQHILFRDPETVQRLAGSFAPLAESVLNLRKAVKKKSWVQLVPTALAYGVVVLLLQKVVFHIASMFATWWIAAGVGLVVISLVVMPEMWKMSKDSLVRKAPPPSYDDDEDDDELALVAPRPAAKPAAQPRVTTGPTVATTVRMRLPSGAVAAGPLARSPLGQHGVNLEAFAAEFNAATAHLDGTPVRAEVTVYTDGTYNLALPDTEPAVQQLPSRRALRQETTNKTQEGAA